MAHLQYFVYPGFGERGRESSSISQAVRVGDKIEISGQGGWDRMTEEYPETLGAEIDQAFANVEHALQAAGGQGWAQVYKLRCYCVELADEHVAHIVRNLRAAMPGHQPIVSVIGVPKLAIAPMRVEIEAYAHLGA